MRSGSTQHQGDETVSRLFAESGISIAASAAMLLLTIAGGRLITATTPPDPATVEWSADASCLQRPLTLIDAAGVQAASWLCLTTGGIQPAVELHGLPSGTLYSAWLSYLEHPGARDAGRCASTDLASDGTALPGRLDGAAADRDGRVALSGALTGLIPAGDTVVEILVVEHGTVSAAGAPARARQLLAWDRSWSALPTPSVDQREDTGRLLGCATFWVRGGVEQTEH
jgi:hypothetical protein